MTSSRNAQGISFSGGASKDVGCKNTKKYLFASDFLRIIDYICR